MKTPKNTREVRPGMVWSTSIVGTLERSFERHRNRGLSPEYEEMTMHLALEWADIHKDWKSMATIYFIDPDMMWQHTGCVWRRAFTTGEGPGVRVFYAADSQKKAVVEEFLRKRL